MVKICGNESKNGTPIKNLLIPAHVLHQTVKTRKITHFWTHCKCEMYQNMVQHGELTIQTNIFPRTSDPEK
jgi:hypothetical protein